MVSIAPADVMRLIPQTIRLMPPGLRGQWDDNWLVHPNECLLDKQFCEAMGQVPTPDALKVDLAYDQDWLWRNQWKGIKGADLKDAKRWSKAVVHLSPLSESHPRSPGLKAKAGLHATDMVASAAQGVAPLKEVATLSFPKKPRTHLPKVAG